MYKLLNVVGLFPGVPESAGTRAAFLREVLHTGPRTAGGGVHALPLRAADQEGPGARAVGLQYQHRCAARFVYSAR